MTPTNGYERHQGSGGQTGQDDLHPLLESFVEDGPEGPFLSHPVFCGSVASPELVAEANRIYERNRVLLANDYRNGNWDSYVLAHASPYQAWKLGQIASQIDNHKDYWQLVRHVWINTDNPSQYEREWRTLLGANRPKVEEIMTASERAQLAQLTDPVLAYRGFTRDGLEQGFSYTTQGDTAEWFARRFAGIQPGIPRVAIAEVPKSRVLAYFEERTEHEILVLPGDVSITAIEPLEVTGSVLDP